MKAWISIRGLWLMDRTIFDQMQIPEGMSMQALRNNIVIECAELEVMLPDPETMKQALHVWSLSRLNAWTKMYAALHADYNPLYNKDGYVDETYDYGRQHIKNDFGGQSGTHNVAGFNSNTLNPADQTVSDAHSDEATTDAHTDTIKRREYGNIGVTTSQAMLEAELKLRSDYDIYRIITEEFKDKFCLQVY